MVTVTIAGEAKDLDNVTERWINRSINPAKGQGLPICAQVSIREDGLSMRLSTPGCSRGGGGRRPTRKESEIFALWEKLGLNDADFTGGNLVGFLKQLQRQFL